MITDSPFKYDGPGIIYPDRGIISDGEWRPNNYSPGLVIRGLSQIGTFANMLEPRPDWLVALSGPNSKVFQLVSENGLASRLGLPHLDAEAIHEAVASLARIIVGEDLVEVEKDERVAWLGYMAVAEAQTLTFANKRAGRVIYGRVRYGYGSENIKKGVDAVLDDVVPSEVEQLVLQQNLSRCMNDSEPAVTEFGGVYVGRDILERLEIQRNIVDPHRLSLNTSRILNGFGLNIHQLAQKLGKVLSDDRLAQDVASVLMQEDYGPAAWLLCCEDSPLEDLTPDKANELITTNTRLLQMRIIALLNSIANGGTFISITDAEDEGRERKIKTIHWMPEEIEG